VAVLELRSDAGVSDPVKPAGIDTSALPISPTLPGQGAPQVRRVPAVFNLWASTLGPPPPSLRPETRDAPARPRRADPERDGEDLVG
jgi:hypothetical protein